MADVIVVDDEYSSLKTSIEDFGSTVEEAYSQYIRIMQNICDTILTRGRAAENLKAFTSRANGMSFLAEGRTEETSLSCEAFVQEIDEADEFLY